MAMLARLMMQEEKSSHSAFRLDDALLALSGATGAH